jgi:hypothetical protein
MNIRLACSLLLITRIEFIVFYQSQEDKPWKTRPSLAFSAIRISSFQIETKKNINGWGSISPDVVPFAENTNQVTAITLNKESIKTKRSTSE